MNEITTKNNTMKITVIILSILLVGSLGFIAYDKLIKKEEPKTEENNKQEISGTYFNITELSGDSREILITLKNDNTFYVKNEEFDYDYEMKGEYNFINNKLELTNIKPTGSTSEFNGDSIFHESRDKFEFDENGNIKKIVLEVKDNTLLFNELSFKKIMLVSATKEENEIISSYTNPFSGSKVTEEDFSAGTGWELLFEKTNKISFGCETCEPKSNLIHSNKEILYYEAYSSSENNATPTYLFSDANGSLYKCDTICLTNSKTLDDMQLLLVEPSIQGLRIIDNELFVKTDAGIQKLIFNK